MATAFKVVVAYVLVVLPAGYTIPAGWLVIVNPMAAHMNEEFFEDPLKFNPWRWMVSQDT